MARGAGEFVTVLVDTRNNIVNAVGELSSGFDGAFSSLQDRLGQTEEALKADARETRNRVVTAVTKATEATNEAASLRREITALRETVQELADIVRKTASDAQTVAHVHQACTTLTGPHPHPAAAAPHADPEAPAVDVTLPAPRQADHDATGHAAPESRPAEPPLEGAAEEERDTVTDQDDSDIDVLDEAELTRLLTHEDTHPGSEPPVYSSAGHARHLLRAAGVSRITLTCHRDTWEFLASVAEAHSHFRTPPQFTDAGDGRVAVELSGRSVVASLIALRNRWETAYDGDTDRMAAQADWMLASTIYARIAETLRGLRAEGAPVTVLLDDRVPAQESASGCAAGEGPS
ncbi:hypothetical protein [Streptomyces sp. RFCAC02]|uniref:hypothetical protein n=1 Tax=Streptomyces sp. RFCAC02 TaxID=2499143 RepID=UPI001020196C|nr:hypothetical protein [Streptomyces sp. RFCAC02]